MLISIREIMASILTYRIVAKKVISYLDMRKIETDNVIETLKNLYDAMNSVGIQINFGRLLYFIRYTYFFVRFDRRRRRKRVVEFLRIRCPNYFPPRSLAWFVSWLIALSLMNYDNLLFHL